MFATNLLLLLALVLMLGIAVWVFKDGEGVGPAPMVRPQDQDDDADDARDGAKRPQQIKVTIHDADADGGVGQSDPVEGGRDG